MSDLRMDSHKLLFHPKSVSDWIDGKDIYPISLEVGLSNLCNHRCTFCAVDYSGYNAVFLDKEIILDTLKLLSEKGLKSVVFSGEGEPMLNKDAAEIITKTKSFGLDLGLSTNGVLFSETISETCLDSLTWIRFSVAAATPETYSKIHQTKKEDLKTVLKNIEYAVQVKKKNNYNTTIGVQLLILPENTDEIVLLGEKLKEIGVDYYTVKPYSQHPSSINKHGYIDYERLQTIENKLKTLQTNTYSIYFRSNAMKKLSLNREYNICHALEFFTHIDSHGNVIPCIMYFGNDKFRYGNLYEENILKVWEKRSTVINKINQAGTLTCREICRLDEMNKYLNELKNPNLHINFI